jgi:hypothetical protein
MKSVLRDVYYPPLLSRYARKLISKPNNNIVLIVICILAFIASILPQSDNAASQLALNTSRYFSVITIIVIPLTLLITAKVKKHAKNMPNHL